MRDGWSTTLGMWGMFLEVWSMALGAQSVFLE